MFTNISCYKFAHLSDLKSLKAELLERCKSLGLKGTILLSGEGINLFIAGPRESVDAVVAMIRAVPGLEGLAPQTRLQRPGRGSERTRSPARPARSE